MGTLLGAAQEYLTWQVHTAMICHDSLGSQKKKKNSSYTNTDTASCWLVVTDGNFDAAPFLLLPRPSPPALPPSTPGCGVAFVLRSFSIES